MPEMKTASDPVAIEVAPAHIAYLIRRMESLVTFFEARDEMNAAAHLEGVKFSPVTLAAQEIKDELSELYRQGLVQLQPARRYRVKE